MDRPVYVSLLVVAVVAAVGFGVLNASTETRMGAGMERGEDTGTRESPAAAGPTAGTTIGEETTSSAAGIDGSGADLSNESAIPYPPGTTVEGIERPSRLLAAHIDALAETGFVVRSGVNATVLESGIRIDATASGGACVAPSARTYYAHRTDTAGPLERRTEGWYGGGVEHRRRVGKFGSVQESTQQARSVGELAGRPLLAPHLHGGAFEAARANHIGARRLFVFTASGIDNESAIETGLPEASTDARSYDARLVVDRAGRVRSLTVRAEYVIGGKRATYQLDYDLARLGNASVERPGWA
ncbi:hypothetical protein BRC86_13810 [Halobacteriales archaeon QS_3_64_16]|nr:MAG: hypothetical protein BRC86_13810 [Halobacteriales archaeon QS_3_64_16]